MATSGLQNPLTTKRRAFAHESTALRSPRSTKGNPKRANFKRVEYEPNKLPLHFTKGKRALEAATDSRSFYKFPNIDSEAPRLDKGKPKQRKSSIVPTMTQ